MQLSTRERDFIVDPLSLSLRAEMGRLLPIFSDPGIVKVRDREGRREGALAAVVFLYAVWCKIQ